MIIQWTVLYPLVYLGMYYDYKKHRSNNLYPLYLAVALSYLVVMSLIPHKEGRFILPIFQISSVFWAQAIIHHYILIWKGIRVIKVLLIGYILINLCQFLFLSQFLNNFSRINDIAGSYSPNTIYHGGRYRSKHMCDLHFGYETSSCLIFPKNLNPKELNANLTSVQYQRYLESNWVDDVNKYLNSGKFLLYH